MDLAHSRCTNAQMNEQSVMVPARVPSHSHTYAHSHGSVHSHTDLALVALIASYALLIYVISRALHAFEFVTSRMEIYC